MSKPKRYRKLPIEIEAMQFNMETDYDDFKDFVGNNADICRNEITDEIAVRIDTLEGKMTASIGDYVIKGIDREFYSCKERIFNMTYEEVIYDSGEDGIEDLRKLTQCFRD